MEDLAVLVRALPAAEEDSGEAGLVFTAAATWVTLAELSGAPGWVTRGELAAADSMAAVAWAQPEEWAEAEGEDSMAAAVKLEEWVEADSTVAVERPVAAVTSDANLRVIFWAWNKARDYSLAFVFQNIMTRWERLWPESSEATFRIPANREVFRLHYVQGQDGT
jgi:hypothetical protein